MINVDDLQERLVNNCDAVTTILIKLGFSEDMIKYHERQNMITSPRPEKGADNPNGCIIYLNSLNVIYTTRAWSGNIFSLVAKIKDISFPEALNLIAKWIGFKKTTDKIRFPFCGFYKKIIKERNSAMFNLPIYKESELPPSDSLSYKFLKDGVALTIQEKWGIRYDHEEDAVLIPIRDYFGHLVGCKARNNNPNCLDSERFWAYLPYQKTLVVYGWYENFKTITEKQTVIIVESEKGVLQAASFGCGIVVAIGGHNISQTQAKYIKMLGVKKIIVAFDEGISEEEIKNECSKLTISNQIITNNVSYIYDRDNIVLPENSKSSPVDFGEQGLKILLKKARFTYENTD